jgi:putative heme-binding domain-containing protein
MTTHMRTLAILALAALPLPALAQDVKAIEPNRGGDVDLSSQDPKVARERLFPAEGYEVELVASEKEFPLLANPVAISFDGRGRLFVATMPSYPQRLPDDEPDDKILILEDIDKDGKSDKCDVFVDKLHVPTGFELGDGGAYVSAQPDILFVKDTDGDGKADHRETVLHGFGTEDSHHAIHVFVWGPDGGLYFQEGTFHHSQVETPYGPVRLKDAGLFRYKPSQQYLEVFVTYAFANPWGHIFDKWGQNFIADASGGSNYFGLPITGYKPYPKKSSGMKVFTSVVRPTAGCEIVSSRNFPDEVQGDFLVNNCIGFQGIKHHDVIEEDSGFTSKEMPPLLYSTDINFRPVDIEFGPDGALYIVDWFNPMIGHMQYSLRDEGRDHSHGRIWRIRYKDKPLIEPVLTEGKPIPELLEALKQYEDRTRYRARNELRSRNADDVAAALETWIAALDPADPLYEHNLLEALWLKQSINRPDPALLDKMLAASEPRARAAAVRVARHWRREVDGILPRLEKAVTDEFPRARLEAITALSYMNSWEAMQAAIKVRDLPMDYYLDYGLNETTTALEEHWKPAVLAGKISLDQDPEIGNFLASRMSADELANILDSPVALEQVLTRPGASDGARRAAVAKLAEAHGGDMAAAWLQAYARVNVAAVNEKNVTLEQYAKLLLEQSPETLRAHSADWESLARVAQTNRLRQAAFVAMARSDGNAERAWKLAQEDSGLLLDLLAAAPELGSDALRNDFYPRVRGLMDASGNVGTTNPTPPTGRYVRIELPGDKRVLTVAELEIYSDRENVAKQGSASQSSTAHGGEAKRAIDGNPSPTFQSGGQTHTGEESNPWLEVDLGKPYVIDFIRVLNRRDDDTGKRLDPFNLQVLDENRIPVFMQNEIPGNERSIRVDVKSDPAGALRRAALAALADLDTGAGDTFALLTEAFGKDEERALAVRALASLPAAAWRPESAETLSAALGAYVGAASPEELASPSLRAAIESANRLAALMPLQQAAALKDQVVGNQLQVRHISALEHKMQYDNTELIVRAGAPVEIIFDNPDLMPHNWVLGTPGSMEDIGLAADAETTSPEAAARQYLPEHPAILQHIDLVQPGKTASLRFTAPTEPGDYPFLCTYPGHWRIMNGVMRVLEDLPPVSGDGGLVRLWQDYELTPPIAIVNQMDPERGRPLFDAAACSRCHDATGEDRILAPPLSEIRTRFYPESLLEHILHPSRKVTNEYKAISVTLKDGREYTGSVATDGADALTLRQNLLYPDFTVTVNKADILTTNPAPTASMMPEHLLAGLKQEEIYALLAYILEVKPEPTVTKHQHHAHH